MLNNIKNLRKDSGFTIVELLIVIVVIGILAAITIVSYTGITAQATLSKYKQDASSIVSVAEIIYNSSTAAYPQTLANFTSTSAKLPGNVTVNATPLTTFPANVTAATPTVASGVSTYAWWPCAAGINVYYPDPAVTTSGVAGVAVAKAGAGC